LVDYVCRKRPSTQLTQRVFSLIADITPTVFSELMTMMMHFQFTFGVFISCL
jgi:hypothetical protein